MRTLRPTTITTTFRRLGSIAFAATLVAASGAWLTARRAEASPLVEAIRAGTLVARLDNVPSHNDRFRASLDPVLGESTRSVDWQLTIERSDGRALSRPTLGLQSWQPEAPGSLGAGSKATYLGRGVFRVDGLRFGRPGWWNVRVAITDAGVNDSLAFNLIIP